MEYWLLFFFKQKTAYEMRISDWSSDVCSSDLPGETAWDVGRRRAARDDGAFSYRNALIIEHAGSAAGCLIGYEIAEQPEPIPADFPAMFRPLQELENLAPGTWYVNEIGRAHV